MKVLLSREHLQECWAWGEETNRRSLDQGLIHQVPLLKTDDVRFNAYIGRCGEAAVAMARMETWDKTMDGGKRIRDQGPFEVRTRSKEWHELFLRAHEPRDVPWVLVTAEGVDQGNLEIRGWIFGTDADKVGRQVDFGGRGKPVTVVSQKDLHDPEEIVDWPRNVLTERDYREWRNGKGAE